MEPDGDGSVSVEILQLSSSMWHKMPALPHPIYGGISAKLSPGAPHGYGDFALVGGSFSRAEILQVKIQENIILRGQSNKPLEHADSVIWLSLQKICCIRM